MRIEQNLLVAGAEDARTVSFVATPNLGGPLRPRYIVVHYTALDDAATALARLTDPAAAVSAHVLVARDGALTQLAPFDRVTWHAGASCWREQRGLNSCAIGIELDNAGRLERDVSGLRTSTGTAVAVTDCIEAVHPNGGPSSCWQRYPQSQLASLLLLCRLLCASYAIEALLGHDEIAVGRKWDPGPAFPMAWLRAQLMPSC